jgi:hypothetical protein
LIASNVLVGRGYPPYRAVLRKKVGWGSPHPFQAFVVRKRRRFNNSSKA